MPATSAKTLNQPAAHAWSGSAIEALFELPFNDLLFRAQQTHRLHFDANAVQRSTLPDQDRRLPEDCGYCCNRRITRPA